MLQKSQDEGRRSAEAAEKALLVAASILEIAARKDALEARKYLATVEKI